MSRRVITPRPGPARPAGRGYGTPARGLGTVLAIVVTGITAAVAVKGIASARDSGTSHSFAKDNLAERRLRHGATILGASVLADSAIEHFRGNYHNPAMYVAPTAAVATMIASLSNDGSGTTTTRIGNGVQISATAIGVAGLGFHVYNVLKRPGAFSWNNLFYAAPIGAPGALAVAGLLGLGATKISSGKTPATLHRWGRVLAGFTGASLFATTAEVALLHFRGSFHNPVMVLPVTLAPAAGLALCATAVKPDSAPALTRRLLQATALLGPIGTAFHAWGVSRNMGGWKNWRQNMLAGPPMPAPASFTGLALAGLAALRLLGRRKKRS